MIVGCETPIGHPAFLCPEDEHGWHHCIGGHNEGWHRCTCGTVWDPDDGEDDEENDL